MAKIPEPIWGVSAGSHDAALAVMVDGKIAFASHSERFSRVKNDKNINSDLVAHAVSQFGFPQKCYWYERPWKTNLRRIVAGQPWKFRDFSDRSVTQREENSFLYLYTHRIPFETVPHHLSHAANAFYTSPFTKSVVVVIDAIGEMDTVSVYLADANGMRRVHVQKYPDSVGLFYSAMTQAAGLKPNEEEYILMARAEQQPLNNKSFSKLKNEFDFRIQRPNGLWRWHNHTNFHRGINPELVEGISPVEIATIAQSYMELYQELFIQTVHREYSGFSENVCYAGGVAMNCVANLKIAQSSGFKAMHIPVDPTDAGSAIGCILAKERIPQPLSPFLGKGLEEKRDAPSIQILPGVGSSSSDYLPITSTPSSPTVAKTLLEFGVLAVVHDKAEFGPRALGNRSLIGLVKPGTKDRLNQIKGREQFRPLAPVVREKDAHLLFRFPDCKLNYSYMQYAVPGTQLCRDLYPDILHHGTGRVQVVGKGTPLSNLLDNLEELGEFEGRPPVLFNTSLNVRGKPIVNSRDNLDEFKI